MMSLLYLLILEIALLAGLVVVLAATGAPTIKYFVRSLSWRQSVRICAWAVFCGFGIYFLVVDTLAGVGVLLGEVMRRQITGYLAIPAFLGTGWFISRNLHLAGHPQSFPGAGAKVVIGWIALSWIATFVAFGISKLLSG